MPTGIYDVSKRRKTKHKLKSRVICKKCCTVFYPDLSIKRGNRPCPNCGVIIDIRDKKGWYQDYCKKHPEKATSRKNAMIEWEKEHSRERAKKGRGVIRKVIFNIISNNNPVCENCGCDDLRLLEINHKHGGGTKESQKGKNSNRFYLDIYKGRRKTDDLNLLCKVCNALHYLELKNGKLPFVIQWNKK
jgi:hypothetical protein